VLDKVEHEPLGVGQQIDVAVAEAGVADESRALARKHLRPVRAREGGTRRIPAVADIQAGLAADGEDQRAGEVIADVIVDSSRAQLIGDRVGLVEQKVVAGDQRALGLNSLVAVQIHVDDVLNLGRGLHEPADGELRQV